MQIREANLKDISSIINLGKNVNEFNTSKEVVTFWPKHIIENCIKSKSDIILVAEEENQIIGFIIVQNSPVFKKAVIENIFVKKDCRNKRVGQKLINEVIKQLKKLNCEYICQFTEKGNEKSINFYLKNGFNRGIDCAWMDKVLSKKFARRK